MGLCDTDWAAHITKGLLLDKVGRKTFGVSLEKRLELCIPASNLLLFFSSSLVRFLGRGQG
ncbi:hypothetical protein T09_410 [Trichinella sp. T9]|nr:hypothetical protein T09_410 [Trichinella sp. T9]